MALMIKVIIITDNGGVKVAFHFNFQASSTIKMVY